MGEEIIQCPRCSSDALYRYGKSNNGKPRYLCLMCHRQFVKHRSLRETASRPRCPKCNKMMHVYMRQATFTRFRCAAYPDCRTFIKIDEVN